MRSSDDADPSPRGFVFARLDGDRDTGDAGRWCSAGIVKLSASMTKDRSKLFADSWLRRVDSREDDLFRPTGPGERDVAATVLSWTPGCDFQSSSRGLTLRCDDREEVDKWLALPGLLGTGSCGEFPRWRFNRPKLCFSQGRSSSSLSSTSSPLLLLWTSVQLPFLAPSPLPGST